MSGTETKKGRLPSDRVSTGRIRNIGIGLLLTAATVLILALLLETAAHLLNYQKHGRWGGSCLHHEPALGWDLAGDCRLKTKSLIDSDGIEYRVDYSTNEFGSRLWGDSSSSRPKVMIVGDSFTDAQEVSDDKTYYAVLKSKMDVEVFAYGVG
ncbi:MAG: hypothetical protein ACR2P3_07050, partial [Geminicoccaceae bacterium]